MSRYSGVVRDAHGLRELLSRCDALAASVEDPRARDAVTLAGYVAEAALARAESRGAHFRRDFPASDARFAARAVVAGATLARIS